jgi:hypothetical protein
MHRLTLNGLKKLHLDYYSLKADAMGHWWELRDMRKAGDASITAERVQASETLYRMLETATSTWARDMAVVMWEELDNYRADHPQQYRLVSRILRRLLDSYEEIAKEQNR